MEDEKHMKLIHDETIKKLEKDTLDFQKKYDA